MLRAGSERIVDPDTELSANAGSPTFGKYQLFATLGRGGMADVFLAVARGPMGFNKLAVIKRLRSVLAEEPSFLTMFLDEARLAARLNHPNVVHTYEVGEQNGAYFIAMEYLEGQSLNKIIKEGAKNAPLEPRICARIVADALAGLHHAHELRDYDGSPLSIIHRDISPHNVFVTYDGQVKLVDFGIAKAALSQTQTEVGVLKGKVAYMAPEQAMGTPLDRRADIFAMGIVLWELLTCKRLMTGESAAATLHRLLNSPIPKASTVISGLDPGLDEIVTKALEKDADTRFQTALEMREALEAWLGRAGHTVRQDEVGRKVTVMFQELRDDVRRQVQNHMEMLKHSTGDDIASVSAESLRRFGSATSSSSSLLALGTGSGSGSGVVPLGDSVAGRSVFPVRSGRGALLLPLSLLAVALAVVVFVMTRPKAQTPVPPPPGTVQPIATTPVAKTAEMPTVIATQPPQPTATAPEAASAASGASSSVKARASAVPSVPVPPKPTHAASATTAPTAQPPPDSPGFLTLDTYPWTRVSENGRTLGTTPLIRVSLKPGPHTFQLENPEQGISRSYSFTIGSGETISRRLAFK